MKKIISLCVSGLLLVTSCTFWEVYKTTETVVQKYPSDNHLENNVIEPFIEEKLGLDADSLDISFWDDDQDKGWIKDSEDDCSCEES